MVSPLALRPDNPMNKTMVTTLVFEAIVFALAFPGMILIDDVSTGLALTVVLVAVVLALVAAGGLKKSWGYPLGWLVQAVGLAMGALTSMMYAVGAIFLILWVMSFVLGRKIENRPPAGPARG